MSVGLLKEDDAYRKSLRLSAGTNVSCDGPLAVQVGTGLVGG